MRDRTRLAAQVEAVRALERERADALEFAELADMEGDQASLDEAARTLMALKERAARAESRSGREIVNVFSDSVLEEGNKADVVVAIFGDATAAGEVVDGVVSVFGNNRVTGSVANGTVAVFGNSYINGPVKEGVVVVFGDEYFGHDWLGRVRMKRAPSR